LRRKRRGLKTNMDLAKRDPKTKGSKPTPSERTAEKKERA